MTLRGPIIEVPPLTPGPAPRTPGDGSIAPTPNPPAPNPSPQPPTPTLRQTLLLHLGVLAGFTALTAAATWPLVRRFWWSSLDYPTYSDTLSSAYTITWIAHALITD